MRILLMLAPLLLLGCTHEHAATEEASAAPIGPEIGCINVDQISGRRVVPPNSIVFEMAGGVTYRNDLKDSCPSAAHGDELYTIALDVYGSQVCENDTVRIFDPAQARATGIQSFPKCRLGKFKPIAKR